MKQSDSALVAQLIADDASNAADGPRRYFRDLIDRAGLPPQFRMQLADFGSGDPRANALRLIRWADGKGTNPDDSRYTTLGSFLRVVLEDAGLETQSTLVAVIVANELFRDQALSALTTRFQVPYASPAELDVRPSPDIDWRGPEDAVELQGLRQPAPDYLDVGFLALAIDRSASVCRLERTDSTALGTGFLIAPDLVVTNYHVLAMNPGDDPAQTAADLVLRFGCITARQGKEADGQTFTLDGEQPIVQMSPVSELDYALLRVQQQIRAAEGLTPLEYSNQAVLSKGVGLNILQHPLGGPMKLAVSTNGVTGLYEDIHRVQYVTRAAGGSSGSPCFDGDWRLAALHHAETSRGFGTIRQGIPFGAIYREISDHL